MNTNLIKRKIIMSVNKVILIGNVGRDPEVRYLDNNVRVGNFTMATTERGYEMSNGTKVPDKTEWHNIVLWRGLAEIAEKYVKKGSQIYIEGKIKTRSYDDKNGQRRYVTEIYGDVLQLLGRRESGQEGQQVPPMQTAAPSAAPAAAAATPLANDPFVDSTEGSADDLPF